MYNLFTSVTRQSGIIIICSISVTCFALLFFFIWTSATTRARVNVMLKLSASLVVYMLSFFLLLGSRMGFP